MDENRAKVEWAKRQEVREKIINMIRVYETKLVCYWLRQTLILSDIIYLILFVTVNKQTILTVHTKLPT